MFGFIVLSVCLVGFVMAGLPVVLSEWESPKRRRAAAIGALVLLVLLAGSAASLLGYDLPTSLAVVVIIAAVLVTSIVQWQIRQDRAIGAPPALPAGSAVEAALKDEAAHADPRVAVSLGRHGRIDLASSDSDVVTVPRRALRSLPDPQ